MQTIAGRDLREVLGDEEEITRHHATQSIVLRYCILQRPKVDAQRAHWNLYDMVDESTVKSVSGEQAEKALGANGGNFDASPILHAFDQRDQAAIDEIGVFDRGAASVDRLAGC